ncbi:hypothetical protein C0989_011637 [Termitomyces sp. Mn162]|nr:hypothetical protein C0989_011637 [Termitomyces sp. Mn162]
MGHPNPYGNCGPPMDGLGCPKHHPFLTVDPITCMVTLHDPENPDCVVTIHPLQIQLYLKYDLEVRQSHGNPGSPMPVGYSLFAEILNLASPDTECQYRLSLYDPENQTWSRVNKPFPNGYLPSSYVDPRLDLLVTLGFISKQGNVDKQMVEDAIRTWRAPLWPISPEN